jgi:4-alpha-glucanotransferase
MRPVPPAGRVTLCLGIHNHQPAGNFDFVFERAVARCYRPTLDAIARHPLVKWNVHFSGPLLLWLAEHDRQLLSDLRALVADGRAEILGSGLGEPVLGILPAADAAAQIAAMRVAVRELVGAEFSGLWLTERVFEPSLPALLAPLGIDYALVDDHHFHAAGYGRRRLSGYHTVEKHGHVLKVFPICEALRYRIPFGPARGLAPLVRRWAASDTAAGVAPAYTYFDDGEKFGLWPGTYEWVFEKGWLDAFLASLEESGDTVETAFLSEVAARAPSGRAALPASSYREMTEWALPVPAARERMRAARRLGAGARSAVGGGFFDQFLVKYEESNRLHKRMLLSSERIAAAEASGAGDLGRARRALNLAQCNDAYWHGLFGGLYLPFLRAAAYGHVMAADRAVDLVAPDRGIREMDFDRDGRPDVLARTADQTVVVSPARGASVYLWDDHGLGLSLTDVLTRREEIYHDKVRTAAARGSRKGPASIHDRVAAKEEGLERLLVYDTRMRLCGTSFLLPSAPSPRALRTGSAREMGSVADAAFEILSLADEGDRLIADLAADDVDAGFGRVSVRKGIEVPAAGSGFELSLALEDLDPRRRAPRGAHVCLEMNLTLNAWDDLRHIVVGGTRIPIDGEAQARDASLVRVVDELRKFELRLELSVAGTIAAYPIETVSASEDGFERIFQGFCVVFGAPLAHWLEAREIRLSVARS